MVRGLGAATLGAMALVAAVVAGAPSAARARSQEVLSYPFDQVWPSSIRFLRVDRGAEILEKDPDSGYILFELPEGKKTWKGSLELFRTEDSLGRRATGTVFTLPDLPRHMELTLLAKLSAKLKDEHGSPAPPPPKTPPKKPPADDADREEADRPAPKPSGKEKPGRPPAADRDLPRLPRWDPEKHAPANP